ncbi:MAG: endonuclease III [Fimbriimonadaceae bacterium]|nr:endonuclease III [Fimbriimonadaceae bacterium]
MPSSYWSPETVQIVIASLEAQYGPPPPIPNTDPLEELVACILSQHTSDANSIPAYERLRAEFPHWQALVEAGEEGVANVIRSAGLANQKSRTIIRCLKEIQDRVGDYSLELLRDMSPIVARNWLTSLPGVGPKTASIVLCFSLGMGVVPVDTHIFRVSWRLGLVEPKPGEGKAHDALMPLVPSELAYRFHMAFIQHGRAVCKAPVPLCAQCVLKDRCGWFSIGGPELRMREMQQKRGRRANDSPSQGSKKRSR